MITVEDIICKTFLTDKKPEDIGSTHTLNYYVLQLNDTYDLWWMFSQQIDGRNLLLDCCLLQGDFQRWKSNPAESGIFRVLDKVMIRVVDFFSNYDELKVDYIDYDFS